MQDRTDRGEVSSKEVTTNGEEGTAEYWSKYATQAALEVKEVVEDDNEEDEEEEEEEEVMA